MSRQRRTITVDHQEYDWVLSGSWGSLDQHRVIYITPRSQPGPRRKFVVADLLHQDAGDGSFFWSDLKWNPTQPRHIERIIRVYMTPEKSAR
jgi:hypothetical protein